MRVRTKRKLWAFAKRSLILVGAAFLVASLFMIVGGENAFGLGLVREAMAGFAEAAADVFGESE